MNKLTLAIAIACVLQSQTFAHEGHSHAPSPHTREKIKRLNTEAPQTRFVVQRQPAATERPEMAKFFEPFADKVKVRWDRDYLLVESNGMPDHPTMTGITAWQQQVPIPQSYTGDNAWRIPLHPVPAKNPLSAKSHFFRGAIALAVNGVPIFNPIKNDGKTDTLKAGELDKWGGHCGRADDYHYHIAPVHLEKVVGQGNPVAVALDGYPIYGFDDPNRKPPTDLDWLNGHKDADGNYHYHATPTYPYLNGGFYGEVVERDGQVDPQPRAQGVRPAARPLRGAKITGFESPKPGSYIVRYDVSGEKRSVEYTVADNGSVTFTFVAPSGTKTETYVPRQRGGGRGRNGGQPDVQEAGRPEPKNERRRGPQGEQSRGRGGDPIVQALDANRDGQIDQAELRQAVAAIRTLDRDQDGQISAQELQGSGVGERGEEGNRPRGNASPRPPDSQPSEGPRQPWILVHAKEVDLNKDKIITRAEIVSQATQAFAGYDANKDDQLTAAEYCGRGTGFRSEMGGFIRGHAKELDRDGDGILTCAEVVGNAERMFGKMDENGDDKLTQQELAAARRP